MKKTASPAVEERVQPQNQEAERALLGSLLVREDGYDLVVDLVSAGDFYRRAHGIVYAAMGRLVDAAKPIEFVTLRDELLRTGELDDVGGPAYVTALADGVGRSANIAHYAEIVREKSRLRQAIVAAERLAVLARAGESRAAEIVADAADGLYELGEASDDGNAILIRDLIAPGISALETSVASGHRLVTGVETGFTQLDEFTAGLQPGDFVIVAARPSQGKTALAMNIASFCARSTVVLVFSLEMSKEQLFVRTLASDARVDSHRLRTGYLLEDDWSRIAKSIEAIDALRLFIDDQGGIGVREVRTRARKLRAKHGLGLIVVDYIQLMRGRGRFDNRVEEIGSISRGLKALARELKVPIVGLSQLSRSSDGVPGKSASRRPQLSDLRGSGDLEQDADVVLFIYRPEPKNDEVPPAEVIIGKQRNGPTATIQLRWSPEFVRFENLAL